MMVNNLGLVGARAASLLLLIFQIILFPVNMVNGNNLFKLEDPLVTTATYEYQIEFNTTTYMNVEEALDKLDEDSKKRLEEDLGEEEDLSFEIVSNTLRSCETPMTLSDKCFEAQSVVTITSTTDMAYVEEATVKEVQNFMDTFNTDNPDIYISFIGPFYISSMINIDIAPVQSKMDDMAREVFEFVLVDHLEESFESVAEDEIVVSNLRADVLFEVLSAMQRARQRRLQPTTGRQQNRVSVFVSGTCNRCSGQDALISDAANKINYNDFMNDLKKEGSNAGTDYFDGLDQASYDGSTFAGIDKPVVGPVSDLPDDKDQPFWIWIALGIAVVAVGGMFAFLYTKKRAEDRSGSKGDFASAVAVDKEEIVEEGVEVDPHSNESEQDGGIIIMDTDVSDPA